MEKGFFERLYDSINYSLNNLYVNNNNNKMTNNKQSIPEQGYYFCTLITGEFFTLWFDGINFHSTRRTYKKEEIKTFIKILYQQQYETIHRRRSTQGH